jgi:hypothetical protein
MPAGFSVLLRVAFLTMLPCVALAQDGRTVLPQARTVGLPGTDAGEVSASQQVPSIAITLQRTEAQQADLDAFLTDVRTKGSSQYHQWLTPEAFAKRFAPASDAVAQVTTWLQSQGLQVNSVAAGGMRLNVGGTAQQTETAFAVSLHRMALASGDAVSVKGTPSVPDAMAGVVKSISGLDATAASTNSVAALADSVDANTSAVLTADLTKTSVSSEELTAVLEQAAAQGQTVVLSGASASLTPERALLVVKSAAVSTDDVEKDTPRPDWQTAQGLPADGLRATPDAAVTDVAALAAGLASVATTSGRQGEIAARFYQIAPEPGVFTHADPSVVDGTWAAADGLGTVDVAKLVKALATGSTNPLSSVIVLSSRDLTHGQTITLTATITGGSGTPTGAVTFASSQGGTLRSVAMTNGVATYSTNSLAGGLYGFYGTYSGDSTYAGSTTNIDTATIQPEAAKVVAGVNGTPLVGTTMAVSVGVSSTSGVGTPSGTVTVWPYGSAVASNTYKGTLATSGSGQATASVSVPATNAGAFTFQANCTTDASFSCSSPINFSVTVGKGSPAMKLTQAGTSTAATLTATVTVPSAAGTGTVAPTGTVQFLDNETAIGSGTLNSSGVATYSGALGSGTTHAVTATYGGDGNYNTATATANATTKVTPSVVLAVVTAGSSLSATVAPPSGTSTIPTGTVQFLDGITVLGTAALNSSGVATYTGSYTFRAGDILTAVYKGDTSFNTATSDAITVVALDAVVSVTPSTTNGIAGQNITLTAIVASGVSTATLVPSGAVVFYDTYNGVVVNLGSASLISHGLNAAYASLSTTGLRAGSHSIVAIYSGDAAFNKETSAATVVNMGDFALSFVPPTATVSQGSSTQFNVIVSGVNSFSGTIALGCTPPSDTETTCSIAPASVGTGSSAVMTITTTKAATSATSASKIALGTSAAGMVALLLMGGRRRRVAALLVLLVAVGLVNGCGDPASNSGGGGTPNSGTPLGTLTFQVVGAAVDAPVAARHTAAVAVTVQ